jgi:hypothetical protein
MFSIIYGPSYPTQIIVVSTLDEANDVVTSLKNGTTFSDVATHVSIDSSALTGGRIDPISVADPIWPSPIREMVSTIEINSISNPIFIGDRWVVLKVTGEPIKSNTTFDEVKAEMEHLAKLAQERLLMDNLSKSLSETNQIKVFDQDLQRILRANSQGTK